MQVAAPDPSATLRSGRDDSCCYPEASGADHWWGGGREDLAFSQAATTLPRVIMDVAAPDPSATLRSGRDDSCCHPEASGADHWWGGGREDLAFSQAATTLPPVI